MPIRRHGQGYEVRIQRAGQRISRSFRSRRDAAEFERRSLQRIEDGRVGRLQSHTLAEAIDRWLGGEAKSLRSFRNLQNKVRAIYPHIVGRRLEEAPEAAEAIVKAALADGLQVPTINRRLAIVRRVCRLAHRRWRWLQHDEAGRIAFLPGEEPRYVQATKEQADKLLRAAKGRTREAIRWAAGTGLRAGELRAIRPENFVNGSIIITKSKTSRPRLVPLQRGLSARSFPYGLTDREVGEAYRRARSAAGMPWLQFRDLRRTFGSWVVQRTKSLKAAQDLLGHSTPTITAKHYAHLLEGDLREAVNTIPNVAGMGRGRRLKKKAA
jgi:integrase